MPHPVQTAHRALASVSRVGILHLLQREDRPMAVADIARESGLHVNTTREHLERLLAVGFVRREAEARTTRGRPRVLYTAAPRAESSATDQRAKDALMKVLLAGYGRHVASVPAEAERAGRAQAAELAPSCRPAHAPAVPARWRQLAALEAHLEDLGFEPDLDVDALEVTLACCPFPDLARSRAEVVCSVHLGIVRGVLAAEGGPLVALDLEALTRPRRCLLRLGTSEAPGTDGSGNGSPARRSAI
jgi:predicted ArsR family transcriptional regulator